MDKQNIAVDQERFPLYWVGELDGLLLKIETRLLAKLQRSKMLIPAQLLSGNT